MLPDTPPFAARSAPHTLPELMDGPCTYEEFRACLLDLEQVNRVTLAYRPTIAWLEQLGDIDSELHIVDVGCGGGDYLRRVAGWLRRRNVRARLTGIDINPYAIRAARELSAHEPTPVTWWCGDARDYPDQDSIDIALTSLCTHHLENEEIIALLRWMDSTARRGWFNNDVLRSRDAYVGFRLLSSVMRWHRFVRHDGPVSIRRGFRPADWEEILAHAGIPGATIQAWRPGRLCVSRTKP